MEPFPLLTEQVYSVSQLTHAIKDLLEDSFTSLWVEGEVSNFRAPSSGHFYFTLKDESTQIRAVMFRSRNAVLPFVPEDGLQVICRANLSVYPPRGDYQLIVESMEPRGQGALQLAFEALKRKLAEEGLFDKERKRPLPFLPQVVGVITSPTGAAVRDIVKVLWRRFPNLEIRFCPVRVQGDQAKQEIVEAVRTLNLDGMSDVIIVGRGGGSLEDLWAFNEESVALAIAESSIPIVSAVGHEIDFTIADFVADVRAPTPSAAAEMIVPERQSLVEGLAMLEDRLCRASARNLEERREALASLSRRLVHPGRRVQDGYIRLDELSERLHGIVGRRLRELRVDLGGKRTQLFSVGPLSRIQAHAVRIDSAGRELIRLVRHALEMKRQQSKEAASCLGSLSPLGVLSRGYSITYRLPSRQVLRSAREVRKGDPLEILLAQGRVACLVETALADEQEEERKGNNGDE
jgi:exodeoxyribonuclease VII large subunit